ncbi:MAG: ribosome biogenesis protein [Candidatus Heimdallarchaeota archaeon]|nr:ribosome biogenesis protein [Candidatus Heimdallarchaeota archaeon]MCK4878246.1 ribosome biogenesis protein [Candidatus Heimdallarchaeota archaeon]
MTKSILRCIECKKYTLESTKCSSCGGRVISPQPARFSLEKERKYSKYRRKLMKEQRK